MSNTYIIGETVPEDGNYSCIPCGYKKELKKGEKFPECIACLESHKVVNMDEVADDSAWKRVR